MRTKRGFTLVELLVVIAIIALLMGLLMPALNIARRKANEASTSALLHSLSMGLEQFRDDHGAYPDSTPRRTSGTPYALINDPSGTMWSDVQDTSYSGHDIDGVQIDGDIGAHILTESLLGLDMLGYQRDHWYQVNSGGTPQVPVEIDNTSNTNLIETKRYGPYVSTTNLQTLPLSQLYPQSDLTSNQKVFWDNPNPVIVDNVNGKPILYYRAHTTERTIGDIYHYADNKIITDDAYEVGNTWFYDMEDDVLRSGASKPKLKYFQYYIWDQKTGIGSSEVTANNSATARPYNADSFLLISAGWDRKYGTEDDICNFKRVNRTW